MGPAILIYMPRIVHTPACVFQHGDETRLTGQPQGGPPGLPGCPMQQAPWHTPASEMQTNVGACMHGYPTRHKQTPFPGCPRCPRRTPSEPAQVSPPDALLQTITMLKTAARCLCRVSRVGATRRDAYCAPGIPGLGRRRGAPRGSFCLAAPGRSAARSKKGARGAAE